MSDYLNRYGLLQNGSNLSLIEINNVNLIPRESIVVIPSGLMPDILLPNSTSNNLCPRYSNTTIITMLDQGDTIIYAGQNFSRSVTCSQQVSQTTQATLAALSRGSLNTTAPILNASNSSPFYFRTPTFSFIRGLRYYDAYFVNSGNGTFIALSNYPSVAWNNNASLLAEDIARAIDSRFWLSTLADGSMSIQLQSANVTQTQTLLTTKVVMRNTPNASRLINDSYSMITLKLSNNNGYYERNMPFRLRFEPNGTVSMQSLIGVSQTVTISLEATGLQKNGGTFHLDIYNATGDVPVQSFFVGTMSNSAVLYEYETLILPSGYYKASLADTSGKVYSSALFDVANITITPLVLNYKNATFTFSVISDNLGVNGVPYSVDINGVGVYNESGVIRNGTIAYTLPQHSIINYGNQSFTFEVLGSGFTVSGQYANVGIKIPSIYIEFAIAIVFVIVLNRILVAPTVDEYYIDVPDFPPSKRPLINEPPEIVLNVFDIVNYYYHWMHMPLTAEEVKDGISNNVRYGNMPISITLQNTYTILNILVDRGLLVSVDEYYAPKKWIEDSGHDIEYLVAFRRLRDYCVANAILFTELDRSAAADVVITSKGVQSLVFIYSGNMEMKDLRFGYKERIFILFLDDESKMEFLDKLYDSYGEGAEMLKMGIGYGAIHLVDTYSLNELSM